MPTLRAFTFLVISILLYFFANQTQVGWLYVMSALMVGILCSGFILNKNSLNNLRGERKLQMSAIVEVYEADELDITLKFWNIGKRTVSQLWVFEKCPLAAPDSEKEEISIFILNISPQGNVDFVYSTQIYRRGVFEFPEIFITSFAPFGLFRQKKLLGVPTKLLVYPELRPLEKLNFLDHQLAEQINSKKSGLGVEIFGIRPYRHGDSPRHIHWHSVAKTGKLISKEFEDETRPGLTIALDLFPHNKEFGDLVAFKKVNKNTTFEWMIKIAASIGDYAIKLGYPLYLLTDDSAWPAPRGPITRQAFLEYLARVHPAGTQTLPNLLTNRNIQTFVVVIIPWPDESIVVPLISLKQLGIRVLCVVIDPATFPGDEKKSAKILVEQLRGLSFETRLVNFGNDWISQLYEEHNSYDVLSL